MRVLMLIDSYPPMIGGAQQYVRNLSVALSARGHDVAVATLGAPGLPPYEEDRGVRIYRLRGTLQRAPDVFRDRTHAPPIPDPELVAAIRDVIRLERPEVVHAHNWLTGNPPISNLGRRETEKPDRCRSVFNARTETATRLSRLLAAGPLSR